MIKCKYFEVCIIRVCKRLTAWYKTSQQEQFNSNSGILNIGIIKYGPVTEWKQPQLNITDVNNNNIMLCALVTSWFPRGTVCVYTVRYLCGYRPRHCRCTTDRHIYYKYDYALYIKLTREHNHVILPHHEYLYKLNNE